MEGLRFSLDPQQYAEEFKRILDISKLFIEHGCHATGPNRVALGKHGRLEPKNPRIYLCGDFDPSDHPGFGWGLLRFAGLMRPRKRVVIALFVMSGPRMVIVDAYEGGDGRLIDSICETLRKTMKVHVELNWVSQHAFPEVLWEDLQDVPSPVLSQA